jgi:hypothetical protein
MMQKRVRATTRNKVVAIAAAIAASAALGAGVLSSYGGHVPNRVSARARETRNQQRSGGTWSSTPRTTATSEGRRVNFHRREDIDVGGFSVIGPSLKPWKPDASLAAVALSWTRAGYNLVDKVDKSPEEARSRRDQQEIITLLMTMATGFN